MELLNGNIKFSRLIFAIYMSDGEEYIQIIQGPSTSVKFLGVQWFRAYANNPSKRKKKVSCIWPLLQPRKRHNHSYSA